MGYAIARQKGRCYTKIWLSDNFNNRYKYEKSKWNDEKNSSIRCSEDGRISESEISTVRKKREEKKFAQTFHKIAGRATQTLVEGWGG